MPRTRVDRRPSPRPSTPAPVPALQRTAGNHAVARALQRKPIMDAQDHVTAIRFTVGTEITTALAQKAKQLVNDAKLDDSDLEKLRTEALADATVNDDERMFMAGLLDASNAAALRKQQQFGHAGDSIDFPEASITPAARAKVADLDRPALSQKVQDEERKRDRATKASDGPGAIKHAQALEKAATAEVLRLAGTAFEPAARATLHLATFAGVAEQTVLRAMIAAASDSTPGDLALAGAVYVIAELSGSPVATDVLAGRIKIDEVPHSAMQRGEWAAYQPMGNTNKGDTIYLPTDLDPGNLGHRGAVVHELQHAADDKAATGPAIVSTARDQHELRAYRRQARFLLDTIDGLSGNDRTNAVSEAGTQWQAILAYAMAIEARSDLARFGPILATINANAVAGAISRQDVTAALNLPAARVEAFVLNLIRVGYGMSTPNKRKTLNDGLAGESLLDWINRPLPPP
jgi:hypothetical protein